MQIWHDHTLRIFVNLFIYLDIRGNMEKEQNIQNIDIQDIRKKLE
jgi:hypothetical protein